MPYLQINLGTDALLVPFSGRIDYVVGRLPRADIQLRDMKVSRLHTQFFTDSRGKPFVRDLGSSGGTILNGARLARNAIKPLSEGSRIRIGTAQLTYRQASPNPAPAAPPSRSGPMGIIRTNARARLAPPPAAKQAPTDTGPAENPPDVNAEDFAGDPDAPPSEPPPPPGAPTSSTLARGTGKRKDTGIVEAPWDAAEGKRKGSRIGKRVTIPGTGRVAPASQPMPSAEIDETGRFHDTSAPRRPTEPPPSAGAVSAFVTPPPPPGAPPPPPDDDEEPRVRMPTVRLDKAAVQARQASEEVVQPQLPTASVKAGPVPTQTGEFAPPRIGMAPGEGEPVDLSGEQQEIGEEAAFNQRVLAAGGDSESDFDSPQTTRSPEPAAPDSGFSPPRKTRKLMKSRTDRLAEEGAAATMPPSQPPSPVPGEGEKTVFIPKPDHLSRPRSAPVLPVTGQKAETLTQRVAKLGRGPGGDTVAASPELLEELRARSDGPPQVVVDEGDTLSDTSAMLTPPPISEVKPRKGRGKIDKPKEHSEGDELPSGETRID